MKSAKKKPQDLTGRNEKHLIKLVSSWEKRIKKMESDMSVIKKHFEWYVKFTS